MNAMDKARVAYCAVPSAVDTLRLRHMARSNNRGEFRVSWPNQIAGGPVAQSGKLNASNVMWRCVAGEKPPTTWKARPTS